MEQLHRRRGICLKTGQCNTHHDQVDRPSRECRGKYHDKCQSSAMSPRPRHWPLVSPATFPSNRRSQRESAGQDFLIKNELLWTVGVDTEVALQFMNYLIVQKILRNGIPRGLSLRKKIEN
jgi:hypothetical protein